MSLNETPSSQRIHIGFFGRRNVGKSSLVNAFTGQSMSVVSDVLGTTTDPVSKAMELLPLGPVLIIDTPGIDDEGKVGALRVKRSEEILKRVDVAVLVCDGAMGITKHEEELIRTFKEKNISYIVVYNKADTVEKREKDVFYVSAKDGENINLLKEKIAKIIPQKEKTSILGGIVNKGDFVVLVTPIDESSPKGRLILPQQQVIRELLDIGAIAVVTGVEELSKALEKIKPSLVTTDSQAFKKVAQIVPENTILTSFSILMANYKGFLESAVEGVKELSKLKDNDKVLICEGCTHHRQCNDIGSVKLPKWILEFTNKKLEFTNTAGRDFPEDLSNYSLVIHCGGCMITDREVKERLNSSQKQKIPFTNYGIVIAHINGILKRSIEVFPSLYEKI